LGPLQSDDFFGVREQIKNAQRTAKWNMSERDLGESGIYLGVTVENIPGPSEVNS
jgi:hypothetical protein